MITASLDELLLRLPALRPQRDAILRAAEAMAACHRAGGKILLCGNGGSAADADHWAGELLKGFRRTRPLSPEERSGLPEEVAGRLQGALAAIPLTGFAALSSAFGNDVEAGLVFAQLTWALGRPGDVWVGLSTSGNAGNVCAAAAVARKKGLVTVGLTGAGGGRLGGLCDVCIQVPETETFRVQECHLPIYHCLSLMLEEEFFSHPEAALG